MPILMFCIAFGLSMDYEVFLLSRIKEEHDRGADTVTSVAVGLERTGRIVTAAAVLIAVVFLAFATGQVSFMKMFGIGLTLAVLVDAFLIRSTLVPAFMRLAGDANWWAPGPLRRFHDRFGISEHVDLDDELAELTASPATIECWRGPTARESGAGAGVAAARATSSVRRSSPRSATCSTRPTTRRRCRSAPSPSGWGSRRRRSIATSRTRTRCSAPSARRCSSSSPSGIAEAVAVGDVPLDALAGAGRCYVEFGLAHPEHYRLVFMRAPFRRRRRSLRAPHRLRGRRDPGVAPPVRRRSAGRLGGVQGASTTSSTAVLAELPKRRRPDVFTMTTTIWTAVHGIMSLRISKPDFLWPTVDEQIEAILWPWREALRGAAE